jgi:3-methyladenine DNA glycosylase/8-oxoguanine DNA glycosylase
MATSLVVTLRLPTGDLKTVTLSEAGDASVLVAAMNGNDSELSGVRPVVRSMLRLDQDLSGFYAVAASDPMLAWVGTGYGRMMRCQSVFEDVIKTLLTTNCAWSATVRMVNRLVLELGERDFSVDLPDPFGRAFPTPAAMASQDESFYRDVIRAGYRAPQLVRIATEVASGELDLERLATVSDAEMNDDQMRVELIRLPGVGPYAAAHIMHMLGRQSQPIFDSWTRPTYAKRIGAETFTEQDALDRLAPYGRWAGLAWWMLVTEEWFADQRLGEAG